MDLEVKWNFEEGVFIDVATAPNRRVIVAEVKGKCRNLLLAERTALNTLSRASGVATEARKSVNIAREHGWAGWIAGTRKTTPGFRAVEKYALLVGGAATHRQDLSQMVMLKDNHIWSAGSITKAVHKAKTMTGFSIKIEVF
jgi:nicotinate-nucleotide pyrophosphorylase (carboxylating)